MKKKRYWWQSWSRLLLWSHVIGVVGFYLILWRRIFPDKKDRVHPLPPAQQASAVGVDTSDHPFVSVIVPARNEERNIRRCVTSLLEQDYANYEVIVVDDGSTDRTGQILNDLAASHPHGNRLYILRLRDELPSGWAGKPHAMYKGAQEARGTWLLFTDADTWHATNALRSTLAQAIEEQADLFTIGSTQELPSFWDNVMMPMAYLGVAMLYPPKLVNDPLSPVAVANGQYILIRRTVYDELGGYARPELRATLLDDRDLARIVKEHGYKLHLVDGRGLLSVHMYHSLDETWRGWRKNAYLGNRGGLAFVLAQIIGLPMVTVIPFLLPLFPGLARLLGEHSISRKEVLLATILELSPLAAFRAWMNKGLGVRWYFTLTHPLAGAMFTAILSQSAWRVLTRRGVDWRGRQYHNGQ
jgi:chlorobactene glucosyltransferase